MGLFDGIKNMFTNEEVENIKNGTNKNVNDIISEIKKSNSAADGKNLNYRHLNCKLTVMDQGQEVLTRITAGNELELRRDRNNSADPNAVAVFCAGSHIGYLPKNIARGVSAVIDNGINYLCVVTKVVGGGSFNYLFDIRLDAYDVHVVCHNCGKDVFIADEGVWNCPYCGVQLPQGIIGNAQDFDPNKKQEPKQNKMRQPQMNSSQNRAMNQRIHSNMNNNMNPNMNQRMNQRMNSSTRSVNQNMFNNTRSVNQNMFNNTRGANSNVNYRQNMSQMNRNPNMSQGRSMNQQMSHQSMNQQSVNYSNMNQNTMGYNMNQQNVSHNNMGGMNYNNNRDNSIGYNQAPNQMQRTNMNYNNQHQDNRRVPSNGRGNNYNQGNYVEDVYNKKQGAYEDDFLNYIPKQDDDDEFVRLDPSNDRDYF